jgi:transcriptional regulator GlxA family with amidase domain
VRQRATQARRVASVCTGAFLLAAAGLLDGRRAATHWMYCTRLAQRFPAVHVEPDPIFVCDGSVWTSAGVTAGIDLALALVEEDLGRSMSLAVARYLVVFLKRPGGQAQFSATLALQAADDRFDALHDWINGHLADDLSLSVLADQAAMSERSFSRHYAEATGQTPARAIERLRVEAARRLLSESRARVKRIAQRCGFGSEETMRRSFLRLLAVTPQDYRSRFTFCNSPGSSSSWQERGNQKIERILARGFGEPHPCGPRRLLFRGVDGDRGALPAAESRLGRRTVLNFPLLPPPQKN